MKKTKEKVLALAELYKKEEELGEAVKEAEQLRSTRQILYDKVRLEIDVLELQIEGAK